MVKMGPSKPPRVATPYELQKLPVRRITTVRAHKWHVAAPLGRQARGDAANYIQQVGEGPSAARRPSLRNAKNFLPAPHQIGVPATMNTEASFGFSRMGYQSSHITLAICGSVKNILRMEGASSRGSETPRGRPAQRSKVGFPVCRAGFAHIAVPVIYEVGDNAWLGCQGMQLRKRMGPRAQRCLAARDYRN